MTDAIRVATQDDIPALIDIARRFAEEITLYGIEFSALHAREYLTLAIDHPEVLVLIGEPGAILIATLTQDFMAEPFAYVEKLYVTPEARGIGMAYGLAQGAIEWARAAGASHVFATATAGISDDINDAYTRLFSKLGLKPCGPVLFGRVG